MAAAPGLSPHQLRPLVCALDILLASPEIDPDTERRATWLRSRLTELLPGARPQPFDLIEARIALLCPDESRRRSLLVPA